MRKLFALVVGGAVLSTAVACSEDPALYFGGPPGADVNVELSSSALTITVGDSVVFGAIVQDEVGNTTATAPTISSCDAGVATVGSSVTDELYTAAAWVKAAGLGTACVVASGGGFSDTAWVTTGPVAMLIFGTNVDATTDTVGSGNKTTFTLTSLDAAGATLSGTTGYVWTSSNSGRLAIDPNTGEAAGKSIGALSLYLAAPNGATARKSVLVVPGVFAGTLSASSGDPGAVITVVREAEGEKFDADAAAAFDGVSAFVDRRSFNQDTLFVAVPATGATGAHVLGLSNMGPSQVAQNSSFSINLASSDRYQPGNVTSDCSLASTPGNISATPSNWIYFVHDGATQGDFGCQNGGAGVDHYFTYTTGAADETVDVLAYWDASGDNDIYVCNADISSCPWAGFSGNSFDELAATGIPMTANTTYVVIWSPWAGNAGINNVRVGVVPN